MLTLAASLTAAAGAAYLSPALFKRVTARELRRKCARNRALVLTYDDGPGPETTLALLELLDEFHASATFFLSGSRISAHRGVAQAIADKRHEIGAHGYHHLHAFRSLPGALSEDMARSVGAVRSITDPEGSSIAFRPPYGKLVLPTYLAARRLGYRLSYWTDDSGDSFAELPSRGASPALDALARGGGVVLMHDLDRSAPRNEFVLDVTRSLLQGARDAQLSVMTLRELDQKPN